MSIFADLTTIFAIHTLKSHLPSLIVSILASYSFSSIGLVVLFIIPLFIKIFFLDFTYLYLVLILVSNCQLPN